MLKIRLLSLKDTPKCNFNPRYYTTFCPLTVTELMTLLQGLTSCLHFPRFSKKGPWGCTTLQAKMISMHTRCSENSFFLCV